jgi:methionine synthase II (cobalamin-independent)
LKSGRKGFETIIFDRVSFNMLKPFSTTGIGSLPLLDAREACRLILGTFDIPFWPQLPKVSFREHMIPQYSEGMPFARIDVEKETVWVERNSSDELERFYESWTEESRIAISEDYAKGLHTFLSMGEGGRFDYVKGHVTGPLTFTLGLKESEGKAVYFDEELREISLMLLKAKTRWQIDMLKQHADGVIIFIDEPILSALGSSSYLGVDSEEALRLLKEMTAAVHSAGAVAGIHCCGNADWPLVIRSGADIINFDAYDYVDTIALYPVEFTDFLESDGRLAWGIVPTSDAVRDETPETVRARFDKGMENLSRTIPQSLLLSGILLTPSCGTGSRTVDETLKVFQLLMRLKEELA